jgi:hypothetical protein
MRLTLALLLGLLPLSAAAEEITVNIKGVERGKSYVLTVAADGSLAVNPLVSVTVGSGPTSPPSDPLPAPQPDTQIEAASKRNALEALSQGGTPDTAARLALVYSVASDECAAGRLPPEMVFGTPEKLGFVPLATAEVLKGRADAAKWETWRKVVGLELGVLKDAGKLTTKDDYSSACREVSQGLKGALGQSGIIEAIPWREILDALMPMLKDLLIQMLLEWIKTK